MGDEALPLSSFLRNRYWILRHGKSVPNEKGLIVSSVENGTLKEFGLALEGVEQAKLAGESLCKELQQNNLQLESLRICYSPFSRTCQTAKAVADVLNVPFEGPQCKAIAELRERYFGPTFELHSHDKYSEIWALDEKDPFMPPEGGESVADVASRLARALVRIETEFQGCAVLVVSHGDPLQILQTVVDAARQNTGTTEQALPSKIEEVRIHSVLSRHRKFALNTGELRQLI